MVELLGDTLSFPLHDGASARVSFIRTLRVPDTGREYDLPAGFGAFRVVPLGNLPKIDPCLAVRGGVAIPMWQAEALWIRFQSQQPVAIKIGAGKINAVTGELWRAGLHQSPQDYVVAPDQPWLDGFAAGKGVVRQFVAAPLGYGATAEEQISGAADHGGLQITVSPLTLSAHRHWKEAQRIELDQSPGPLYSLRESTAGQMGLGAGGKIRQHIYPDPFAPDEWSPEPSGRVSVTIFDAFSWKSLTGSSPPTPPITAREYSKAGIPWFAWYGNDARALTGSPVLRGLRSVQQVLGLLPGDSGDIPTTVPIKLGPAAAAITEDSSL